MSRKEGPRRGGEDVNGSGQWVLPIKVRRPVRLLLLIYVL